MFSSMQQTLRQMAVCAMFADQLLDEISRIGRTIPNLPATSGMTACVHIPLCNGYALSVSFPSDKNHNLAELEGDDRVIIETSLIKNGDTIYDDELGYSEARTCAYNAQAILAEHERLMQKLIERT